MTNYIEEMMKTAGVEPYPQEILLSNEYEYPDFTPAKQLEIIKLIFKKCFIDIQDNNIKFTYYDSPITYNMDLNDFAQNLAALVNNIWRKLTELDKEKVKEILSV